VILLCSDNYCQVYRRKDSFESNFLYGKYIPYIKKIHKKSLGLKKFSISKSLSWPTNSIFLIYEAFLISQESKNLNNKNDNYSLFDDTLE